jgi:hypothetical protein
MDSPTVVIGILGNAKDVDYPKQIPTNIRDTHRGKLAYSITVGRAVMLTDGRCTNNVREILEFGADYVIFKTDLAIWRINYIDNPVKKPLSFRIWRQRKNKPIKE